MGYEGLNRINLAQNRDNWTFITKTVINGFSKINEDFCLADEVLDFRVLQCMELDCKLHGWLVSS
jgi:hypothetical protein